MNRKGFVPILLAVILAIVVVAGVGIWLFKSKSQFTPTQTTSNQAQGVTSTTESLPTVLNAVAVSSTWKTYTNAEYGFQFQYPPQLSVTAGPEVSGMIRVIVGGSVIID